MRAALVDIAGALLDAIDVADPAGSAVDLVGLIDALLLYRTAKVRPMDPSRVLTAYLAGLARR